MIERLLTLASIPEWAIRRSILGKITLCLFHIGAEQSTHCGGPVCLTKDLQREPKKGFLPLCGLTDAGWLVHTNG